MKRTDIKIATLNLYLGLKNKKQLVDQMMKENKIDIFCLLEVEIESDLKTDLLNIAGYALELECNAIFWALFDGHLTSPIFDNCNPR